MQALTLITVGGPALLLLGALPSDVPGADSGAAQFDAPVLLTCGDAALGSKTRYPSPRLLDFDGDGARELILGDLSGTVRVALPSAQGNALGWTEPAPLTTDGRELKFHNW